MKHKKIALKTIAAALAVIGAMSCASATAFADKIKTINGVAYRYSDSGEQMGKYTGWAKNTKGRRYYKNGVLYKNKWIQTKSGKRYYAGNDGYMITGWKKIKSKWYYFDEKGVMSTGTITLRNNKYTFSKDGIWNGKGKIQIGEAKGKIEAAAPKEAYGGLYYDDGIIVIQSVDTSVMQNVVNELYPENAEFYFAECEFSLYELEKVRETLKAKRDKYDMAVLLDVVNNCVIVTVRSKTDELNRFIGTITNKECVKIEIVGTNDTDD